MYFSAFSKIRFYLSLGFYNLYAPLECRNYRLKVLLNEFNFLFVTLGINKLSYSNKARMVLNTNFGNFKIRDICWELKVASPAYERLDMNELQRRISDSLRQNHKVVFFDIGSQFGSYSIAIGNKFKKFAEFLTIYAFEPDPENFSLLKENVRLNNLKNMKVFNFALSNKRGSKQFYYFAPQNMIVSYPTSEKIIVKTEKLDSFMSQVRNLESHDIFIKLDVEGHETEVLNGGLKFINGSRTTTLLVEDSFGVKTNSLVHYLKNRWRFLKKITPYNSFWRVKQK